MSGIGLRLGAVCVALSMAAHAMAADLPRRERNDFDHRVLDLLGHRPDKNSVGHGRNVALYTGMPSKFFFATHNLGSVFGAVDGMTLQWFPDHALIAAATNRNSHPDIIDQREVCVTDQDVIVSRIHLTNRSSAHIRYVIDVAGDCRKSFDWREKPAGEKRTDRDGRFIVLRDSNVFPAFLKQGLAMVVGSSLEADKAITEPEGTYALSYVLEIPANRSRTFTIACAIDADSRTAVRNLRSVLKQKDPIGANAQEWARFFAQDVPRFRCSDRGLEELYAFRWFLLRFSTAGGNLGYFKYPVVLEGRQAYQTYCCYSAPFMAFDLNWASHPKTGAGHIANMVEGAYEDGRFPWYMSPRTNRVKLDHPSASGLSLLPAAAWKHYLTHGDKKFLRQVYAGMKKNVEWWIKDRDPKEQGLFQIAHQYETGMDDLHRWGGESMAWRYEAVDATSYAIINMRAVAQMARVLKQWNDERYFTDYIHKATTALNSLLWDGKSQSWRDRHPQSKELADVLAITTFYPFLSHSASAAHLGVLTNHLLNADQFWLPHPVPALAKDQRDFNPNGFWQGPSWPAATTHVIEAFSTTAKEMDRTLLPRAADLFRRAAYNHLQPRADFYERYNPITGKPLSTFRDYMHSWWIDLIIRHVAGLMITDDGAITIDPLPMDLDYFALEGAPCRGKKIDMSWRKADGLLVRINGKTVIRDANFAPGYSAAKWNY